MSGSAILRGFCWVPRRKEIAKKKTHQFLILRFFEGCLPSGESILFDPSTKNEWVKKTGVEQSWKSCTLLVGSGFFFGHLVFYFALGAMIWESIFSRHTGFVFGRGGSGVSITFSPILPKQCLSRIVPVAAAWIFKDINFSNFQRWMSWLAQRWRTQRTAIRSVNCRIQWIIRLLNAKGAVGVSSWRHVCFSVSVS